jgi:S1-C subfamily serine protease
MPAKAKKNILYRQRRKYRMRNIDLFDSYLYNRQNTEDRKFFEERLASDESLKKEFEAHKAFVELLQSHAKQEDLKRKLSKVHTEEFGNLNVVPISGGQSFYKKYGRTIGMAASVALIVVTVTLALLASGGYLIKKHDTSITNLSKEVRELKSMQEGIIDGIMSVKPAKARLNANIEGTGFALNSKGYFITSLHMVKGADSVFVIDKDQNAFHTRLVVTDPRLDIAILKIENDSLSKFPQVPYAFRNTPADLGEKIFTLGFPAESIVYSEGSLAATAGGGDTALYQVSAPINPGNSGGPLFDEQGNIIGVIKSKNRAAEATGFAVKSNYLLELIKNTDDETLQSELKVNTTRTTLKSMKRSEQIKRITPCVYNIKVFKGN